MLKVVRKKEERRGMERGRKTGGRGEGTERRELRAKRKDRMGVWEGEAGRERRGGGWELERKNLKILS